MDLQTFRQIVDKTSAQIVDCQGDPERLYSYAGLDFQTSYQLSNVSEALYGRIRNALARDNKRAWNTCRSLETDLIREHVIFGVSLEPYFDVLNCLRDGLNTMESRAENLTDNWEEAIQAARDKIEISNFIMSDHRRLYAREFAVAEAAKYLMQQGYGVRLEPGLIILEEGAEESLVADIQKIVIQLGGLNVARRIFAEISSAYDAGIQRYQIVPHVSMTGGGLPQVPWGYLLQLAVKHIEGKKPYLELDRHWSRLLTLITNYAAVVDVQPYSPSAWANFDAKGLIKHLQEQALYDSMFRFLQLRSSDVLRLCRGALDFVDGEARTPDGWTLNEAFEVIGLLIDATRNVRGPVIVAESEVRRALPHIAKNVIATILRDVLAHPLEGPNCGFSRPTDAPTPSDKSKGADFYLKPLILRPGNRYLIVDGSMCGWGYIEALLTALRSGDKKLEDKVGLSIERFIEKEFSSHGVPTLCGDYDINGEHGECDLVAMTPQTLLFFELKKKSLTRRARAGSDGDLLLDLAGSLLAAQAQAGWHELRLKKYGSLALNYNGETKQLLLDDRGIEKIALGMLDFGSFQDRILLKHFLEATLSVTFSSPDPLYDKRFGAINESLQEIREQYSSAHQGKAEVHQPFFNCWFISIPQLLILLDRVTDANSFRSAIWSCRHFTSGTSDFYYEISQMRRLVADSESSQAGSESK